MKHVTHNMKIMIMFIFVFASYFMFHVLWTTAQVQLETGLPGHSTVPTKTALPSYIQYLFIFGLSLITILALAQMIIGGIIYILAAGNAAKVEDAKDTIFQALFGLGILLISYLLLRTINPDLVNLRNPNLTPTQFQTRPTPPTPPTPIPIGTKCRPGDHHTGFICVNGAWVKISGNANKEYPPIALIK